MNEKKGIILHVHIPGRDPKKEQLSFEELDALVYTLGFSVHETVSVKVREISAGTYLGIAALQKVKAEIEDGNTDSEEKIQYVYFSDELTGSQHSHLEKEWGVQVMDRVNLILRIFERHARTKEAKLQVEIAELEYLLPRLRGMWTHFSRIEGGIGFSKGPGEKQLEIDRRLVKDRLTFLRKKLKKIETTLHIQGKKRSESEIPQVALVGYTNVGKTSLLEVLSKENFGSMDKVFATLSPTIKRVYLKDEQMVLISDTVGFISNLPHFLLASFRSTFRNIFQSQVLFLIQDAHSPYIEEQLQTVKQLLEELGVQSIPQLLVFNKVDLLTDFEKFLLQSQYPGALLVSAKKREDIGKFKEQISQQIESHFSSLGS